MGGFGGEEIKDCETKKDKGGSTNHCSNMAKEVNKERCGNLQRKR